MKGRTSSVLPKYRTTPSLSHCLTVSKEMADGFSVSVKPTNSPTTAHPRSRSNRIASINTPTPLVYSNRPAYKNFVVAQFGYGTFLLKKSVLTPSPGNANDLFLFTSLFLVK